MNKRIKSVIAVIMAAFIVFGGAPLASLAGLTGWIGSLSVTASALTDNWDGGTASGFASGTGTQDDPYIIETAEQLAYLSASVNNTETTYSGSYIKLANNIVLNSPDVFTYDEQGRVTGKADGKTPLLWDAIGSFKPISITNEAEYDAAVSAHGSLWRYNDDSSSPSYGIDKFYWQSSNTQYYYEAPFAGVFDGNGCVVSGICTSAADDCQGLFGQIKNATVKNVGVIGSYIEGKVYIGGIVGKSCQSTVSDCFNTAAVKGLKFVGGIAGNNETGQINNCRNSGNVSGTGNVGGVTGNNQGDNSTRAFITNSRNRGTVSGESYVGGVAGKNTIGTITGSSNSGYIFSDSRYLGDQVGGIAGLNDSGIIENCRNTGCIDGRSSVGGVAGGNQSYLYESIISHCCNTGDISGMSDVGGITGDNINYLAASVTDCYNTGSIYGGYGVGGVVGSSMIFDSYGLITRNYSTGSVPGTRNVGGIVGTNDYVGSGYILCIFPYTGGISSGYYLSGSAIGPVNGGGSDGHLMALTDAEMKIQSSFVGWDFSGVWTMDGNPEYPYPELQGMEHGQAQTETVSVSQSTLNLVSGKTYQLSAEASPTGELNSDVVLLSSNPDVVSVSDSGLVTAVANGTAVITVTVKDGGFTSACTVAVTTPLPVSVGGVTLSDRTLQLKRNESAWLIAKVAPTDAANKNVTWTSSNIKVATVDVNGIVTAVSGGKAVITVATKDGGYTASCTVTVKQDWWQLLFKILLFGWIKY